MFTTAHFPGAFIARMRTLALAALVVLTAAAVLATADVFPAHAQDEGPTMVDDKYSLSIESIDAVTEGYDRPGTDSDDVPYLGVGEVIFFEVQFSDSVAVDTAAGVPALDLVIGDNTRSLELQHVSESDDENPGDLAVFAYTVASDDLDDDGFHISASSEDSNGVWTGFSNYESITAAGKVDSSNNAITIDPDHDGWSHTENTWFHGVDGSLQPFAVVTAVTSTPSSGGVYLAGSEIEFFVNYSVPLDVAGTPVLGVSVGDEATTRPVKEAVYKSGSGTATLLYAYTVQEGDRDVNGVSIPAQTIEAASSQATSSQETSGSIDLSDFGPGANLSSDVSLAVDTGYSVAGTGWPVTLVHTAMADQSAHKVNGNLPAGSTQVGDDYSLTINSLEVVSTPRSAESGYTLGETLEIEVKFSDDVVINTASGTPWFNLWVGPGGWRSLSFTHMSSPRTAIFGYDIQERDRDTDGIVVDSSYRDSSGTLHSFANHQSITAASKYRGAGDHVVIDRNFSGLGTQSAHKVDGRNLVQPELLSVAVTSTPNHDSFYNLYSAGAVIEFTATFNEPVTVNDPEFVTNPSDHVTPSVYFLIGDEPRFAEYVGVDGAEMTFRYTAVRPDKGRIRIEANPLWPGTAGPARAEIRDAHGLRPDISLASGNSKNQQVDTVPPTIERVGILSSAGADGIYETGDRIEAAVVFNERVWGFGSPQIELDIGGVSRLATFIWSDIDPDNSLNGSDIYKTLIFGYTVTGDDVDADGVSISANSVTLNGGRFTDFFDNESLPADLAHEALAPSSDHKVNHQTTAVESVAVTSCPEFGNRINNVCDGTYGVGEAIEVTVTFDRAVDVSGTPSVGLTIGTESRAAGYVSSDGPRVKFSYTVVAGDLDENGIDIPQNAISLGADGVINSGVGSPAVLDHSAVSVEGHTVDAVGGTISSVRISSSAGDDSAYGKGDTIEIEVSTNEAALVVGTPQVVFELGGLSKSANFVPGPEGDEASLRSLKFAYTVVEGDVDADGVSIAANSISLNGGTIEDRYGNPYNLAHDAVAASSDHWVLAPRPGGL